MGWSVRRLLHEAWWGDEVGNLWSEKPYVGGLHEGGGCKKKKKVTCFGINKDRSRQGWRGGKNRPFIYVIEAGDVLGELLFHRGHFLYLKIFTPTLAAIRIISVVKSRDSGPGLLGFKNSSLVTYYFLASHCASISLSLN